MNAVLALEDGTWFSGTSVGAPGETSGEVVFNTSMTGYQEVLTDPSYAGQIVTICPAYDGSVSTSWYPVMLVLNTTSPLVSPGAPADTPRYQVPSSSARVAFIGCA